MPHAKLAKDAKQSIMHERAHSAEVSVLVLCSVCSLPATIGTRNLELGMRSEKACLTQSAQRTQRMERDTADTKEDAVLV